MNNLFILCALSVTVLHCTRVSALDSHGNAIYTRMELIDIMNAWCTGKPYLNTMMKRFATCRQASLTNEIMDKGAECASKFIKDFTPQKMKEETEEEDKQFVCSKENKAEVLDIIKDIWECGKFSPETMKEFNDNMRTCMEKAARAEEEEFLKSKKS